MLSFQYPFFDQWLLMHRAKAAKKCNYKKQPGKRDASRRGRKGRGEMQ